MVDAIIYYYVKACIIKYATTGKEVNRADTEVAANFCTLNK